MLSCNIGNYPIKRQSERYIIVDIRNQYLRDQQVARANILNLKSQKKKNTLEACVNGPSLQNNLSNTNSSTQSFCNSKKGGLTNFPGI